MTFERLSNPSSVELTSGSTTVFIQDIDNLIATVSTAHERTQLTGDWFDENQQQHLLESAIWLERIDDSERVLYGQILLDPLTHIDQPDATLVTLYAYLVTAMGYDAVPSTFEMDTDERWVIAIGDSSDSATFIRIEAFAPDETDKVRSAHQISLSMKLAEDASPQTYERQTTDFLQLWATTHNFIQEQSNPSSPNSDTVTLTVPSSRLEDEELRIWQALSEFEVNQQNELQRKYSIDMTHIDVAAVALAAQGLDIPIIHRALTRIVITKVVELSLTGAASDTTTEEVIASINRIRNTQ